MNRKFVFGCVVALAVMFSACDKDQDVAMQHDDAAKVELKSVWLVGNDKSKTAEVVLGVDDLANLFDAEVEITKEAYRILTEYNGNSDVRILDVKGLYVGVTLGKGATRDGSTPFGNGNTRWIIFEDAEEGADVGSFLLGYKWGNTYRVWSFNNLPALSGYTFVFDGRPLSGIAYGFEGGIVCDDLDLTEWNKLKVKADFIFDNEVCFTKASFRAFEIAYNAVNLHECKQEDFDKQIAALKKAIEDMVLQIGTFELVIPKSSASAKNSGGAEGSGYMDGANAARAYEDNNSWDAIKFSAATCFGATGFSNEWAFIQTKDKITVVVNAADLNLPFDMEWSVEAVTVTYTGRPYDVAKLKITYNPSTGKYDISESQWKNGAWEVIRNGNHSIEF